MKPSKEKQIYYAKYVFVMLTSIMTTTTTTNATEKRPHNGIEIADFGAFKAWQFSMYNITIDRILVAG